MKTLVVIPARYASTRFPGKPLALLGGESIVSRVWKTAAATVGADNAWVATDDERILDHINTTAGREAALMTSSNHRSGTDRCGEALQRLEERGQHYDIIINLQGDEPFVTPSQIETLQACFEDPSVQIATLRTRIGDTGELLSPNNVKVVCASNGNALYFSRQPLPYRRGVDQEKWLEQGVYHKHVGIYAFRCETLKRLCRLQPCPLEESESLEQLRWLDAGYSIKVCDTEHSNIGIDTPEDLQKAEEALLQQTKN